MSRPHFQKIALMGRKGVPGVDETLVTLLGYLQKNGYEVTLESDSTEHLTDHDAPMVHSQDLHQHAELLIVVGGDGSLLNAAHNAVLHDLPLLGINRGRLGFLTDIHPNQLTEVNNILQGQYQIEERFLLQAEIKTQHHTIEHNIALNDVVLLPGDIAQMIEFDVYVNTQLVCHHRADGMIIATPTGSTAYALSGGGPILYPNLNAIALVPMFPHTLSSRPIVISNSSTIIIKVNTTNETSPYVSCDGATRTAIMPGGEIVIKKFPKTIQLIHPLSYNYFHTLREKLNWEKQATRDPL